MLGLETASVEFIDENGGGLGLRLSSRPRTGLTGQRLMLAKRTQK